MDFNFLEKSLTKSNLGLQVNEETQKLAKKLGLKYRDELTELSVYVYPNLDLNSLIYCNNVHMFLWLFDDIVDDNMVDISLKKNLINESIDILNGEILDSDHPVLKLLLILVNANMNINFIDYLKNELKNYIMGVREHLQIDDKNLSVSDYINIRLKDGACEVVWPLMFCNKNNFKEYEIFFNSDIGLKARLYANKNVSFVNDILSIKKDIRDGISFNIVMCWMKQYNISMENAIKILVNRCNEYFLYIESIQTNNELEKEVINGLCTWCKGSLLWHLNAMRYKV